MGSITWICLHASCCSPCANCIILSFNTQTQQMYSPESHIHPLGSVSTFSTPLECRMVMSCGLGSDTVSTGKGKNLTKISCKSTCMDFRRFTQIPPRFGQSGDLSQRRRLCLICVVISLTHMTLFSMARGRFHYTAWGMTEGTVKA